MTDTKELLPCQFCGKSPIVSKYPKPKDFVSLSGETHPTRPFVSIQCKRHDNILVNVNVSGDTIEKALDEAIKSWNEFCASALSPDTVTLSEVIDALNKTTELLDHNFSDFEYIQDQVRKNKAILNKHGENK